MCKNLSFLIVLLPLVLSCSTKINDDRAVFGLQNGNSQTIIDRAEKAFDLAELEIFAKIPVPDDEPIRPDLDANKCPCKGTGQIVHGDGHITKCPFHSSEFIIKKTK